MRSVIVCVTAALLVGCHYRQPKISDVEMQRLRAAEPGMTEKCLNEIRWGGTEALTGEPEDCYKFDPPRRWKGLFLADFETSRFCPAPARACSEDGSDDHIWLEAGSLVDRPLLPWKGNGSPGLYEIDFVGQKTTYPGAYGHMGQWKQEIVMDRLISIKKVQLPKE